jgi:hypothetical protein
MSEPSGFPAELSESKVILDYESLRYNPCEDLIFPCVVRAGTFSQTPLAAWYMYYAPHNAPGGICLALADRLEGPWREHDQNPLITNVWSPHYRVGHVSSPHAVPVPESGALFLYYHGDNDVTHYATSVDGVAFDYGGVALDREGFEAQTGIPSRVFYGRVFRHASPSGRGRFVLMFLASFYRPLSATDPSMQGLYCAWSHDGRGWEVDSRPLLVQSELGPGEYACSPFLISDGDRHFILYHRDFTGRRADGLGQTDVYRFEVDAEMRRVGPQELVCPREAFGEDNLRASDPCPVVEGKDLYLFLSVGPRLNQRIGLTKMSLSAFFG